VPQSETDTLLALAPGAEAALELLPPLAEPLPALDVPTREGLARYRFFRLPAGQAPDLGSHPSARLANGVQLIGAAFTEPPQPGHSTRLLLYWRVIEVPPDPPPQGYSFANHLLTASGQPAEGQRVAQADGPGHPVALWRSGDTLISAFDLSLPADAPPPPYRLRAGMYVYTPPDQFTTIPVVDAQGVPLSPAVEWDLPQAPP
jgi:hypothetical protein